MSRPFVLWALQRTGGTTFFRLLRQLSEHPALEDEPFNEGRSARFIYDKWMADKDPFRLVGHLIKHCYDGFPKEFNEALVKACPEAFGYVHIILDRRDELARICSKFLAESNGTWWNERHTHKTYDAIREGRRALAPLPVDEMISYRDQCAAARASLSLPSASCVTIMFEDLFFSDRIRYLHGVTDFLGIKREVIDPTVLSILLDGDIDTYSIIPMIPNYKEILKELS